MMQLCKIHFASAKKASVQPYIFFLIFCGAEKKGRDHTIFQMQRKNETPQKVPSPRKYLLESAKIHRVKNVLCVIRMLLQRDRLLEGFGLQRTERESEGR